MVTRHPNIWKLLIGLLLVSVFAPLPDTLDKILSLVIAVPLLVFWGAIEWEDWRERQADQSSSAVRD